jgi:hypothetical protein
MVPCKALLQDHFINKLRNKACDDSSGKGKVMSGVHDGLSSGSSAADAILD